MKLPTWAPSLYPRQISAIQQCLASFKAGNAITILDAPTGSGKTLIADIIRQSLGVRSVYTCSSISLQHQFARDFPSASIIKGRSNYSTADDPNLFPSLTAGDCTKSRQTVPACPSCPEQPGIVMHCRWCHTVQTCPYEVAKREAIRSPLVCTNLHYLLYEANYQQILCKNRGLIILDEADTIEDVLLSFIEVSITARRAKEFGIEPPARKTVESAWVEWAEMAYKKVKSLVTPIQTSDGLPVIRRKRYLFGLSDNLARLVHPDTGISSGGWVYTGYAKGDIQFKPVKVDSYAGNILWRHAPRFLLMSATTISFASLAESLGIEKYGQVSIPSDFPPANRPIYITPVASMSRKNKDDAYPKVAKSVVSILDRHPKVKILVHTVSYDLNGTIFEHCQKHISSRPLLTYTSAGEKQKAIDTFLSLDNSAVLFAPSLDRGIDLPHDNCRVVVVCKVPFPSLGDKQISTRLHTRGGQTWYNVKTVRSLVQMTGRGMRSQTDHCESYILDKQFLDLTYRKSKQLLPSWWKEALIWDKGKI